jgi:hypothetical protein
MNMLHMIDFNTIYIYGLLTLFFSMDAGLTIISYTTHIRSKGAMHINQTLRERCGSISVTAY